MNADSQPDPDLDKFRRLLIQIDLKIQAKKAFEIKTDAWTFAQLNDYQLPESLV